MQEVISNIGKRYSAVSSFVAFTVMLTAVNSANARPINIDINPPIQTKPIKVKPETPPPPPLPALSSARSAIVIDLNTGDELGVKNPNTRLPMASTTKIMTALLVLEEINSGRLSLNTIETVSQSAGTMGDMNQKQRSAGSIMGDISGTDQDTSVGLSPGDTVSINDLLYGLLLDSGNDAAIALSEAVSGSEAAFVEKMNARAQSLGLTNTRYANPHGRDPLTVDKEYCECAESSDRRCHHYSSARDLANLALFALDIPLFSMIVSTRNYSTTTWSARFSDNVDSSMDNSNRMIRTDRTDNPYVYPGAFGVKTGTTDRAGFCLVSAADSQTYSTHSVLAVVLGTTSNDDRYSDSAALLDYGFSILEQRMQYMPPVNEQTTGGGVTLK